MSVSTRFSLWQHLSRTQIGLSVITILLTVAMAVLLLFIYFNILAANTVFKTSYIITDLSDIQRGILLLRHENSLLWTAQSNSEAVELQRALLAGHMRLALTEAAGNEPVMAGLIEMRRSFEQYEALLRIAQADPTSENLAATVAEMDAILVDLEKQSKRFRNQEETLFFNEVGRTLQAQKTIQTLLLILGGLFQLFGVLLVFSLRRTIASQFDHTYHLLAEEVTERKEAEAELRESHLALETTNQYLQTLNDRLQKELNLAHTIQQGLLPPPYPAWPGLDVACLNMPALEVGGDFYAYQDRKNGTFALAVGDVSGKGLPAALLMATSLAHFDSVLATSISPGDFLARLDQALTRYTGLTNQNCALCYIEVEGLTLRVANAGGVYPYIRRANGQVTELEIGGVPLGVGLGAQAGYQTLTLDLAPGDLVILTTDGVAEANTNRRHLFGFDRLQEAVAAGPTTDAQAMLNYLKTEVTDFLGEATLPDDVTIAVLQVLPDQPTLTQRAAERVVEVV